MRTLIAVLAVIGLSLAAYMPAGAANRKMAKQAGCGAACVEKAACDPCACTAECAETCIQKGACTACAPCLTKAKAAAPVTESSSCCGMKSGAGKKCGK